MYELRRDGGAPLRRPRVDAWALAATSAPSLLGLKSCIRGSPSGRWAKQQHRGRRFASQRRAAQASWPGAAGGGQNALAPRPAAIF